MSLFKKLARDSLWLLLARLGAQVSMVIVTYLLARRLGATGFGEYAFLATAVVIGNVLTTFGSDMVLIREIAAKDDLSEGPSILILQLLLSLLILGIIFLFATYLPNQTPESILALKVYSFALIPLAFFSVSTSILRGMQRMAAHAHLNLVLGVVQVVAVFIFVQRGTGIVSLAWLLLGVQAAGAILGWLFCFTLLPDYWSDLHFSSSRFHAILATCLPVAAIAILGILYQKTSLAMLSFMGVASMVGVFSVAARVIEVVRIGHFAVLTALYPMLVNVHRDKAARATFGFSWLLFLVISTGISFLLFLFASPIVEIFFGREYQPSTVVLKILAFTLIPYTVNSFLPTALLAQKKEKIVLRVLGLSLFMLLALNLILIPETGQVGASCAILTTEIAQSILFLWVWAGSQLRQMDVPPPKGVPYELSDSP